METYDGCHDSGFLSVLRSGMLAGRFLEESDRWPDDREGIVPAAIDEALALKFFTSAEYAMGTTVSFDSIWDPIYLRNYRSSGDPLLLRQHLSSFDATLVLVLFLPVGWSF